MDAQPTGQYSCLKTSGENDVKPANLPPSYLDCNNVKLKEVAT